jgi:peroxiredoxin
MIEVGQPLPQATLRRIGANGPEEVALSGVTKGRKVIMFGVPGAFTPTCSSAHMPSFVRTADALREKGVDEIVCVSVNDAHVMRHWAEATGANTAGILCLADSDAALTEALGLLYDNPAAGMFRRCRRFALIAEDGVVTEFHLEQPGVCEVSTGEAMLAAL